MGGDLTLAAWVYDEDTSASWGRIVDLGNGAPGDNILLCHDGTAKRITYQVYHGSDPGQDNPQITADAAMPAQQWVFVLLVQAGGTATLVLDTGRGPVVAAQGPVEPPRRLLRSSNLVGQSNWAGDAMFRGRVRGLAVWDRALDRAEWAAYASWSFETGTVPVSGLLSLCRQPSPPPPPVPAPAIRVNASQPAAVVPAELLGLDLEFTRHDIWEGLSSQLVANRMFALQPVGTKWPYPAGGGWGTTFPGRWVAIGAPRPRGGVADRYGGEGANAMVCPPGEACGVAQGGWLDGFNAGVSFGSAIVLGLGRAYSLQVVLRAPSAAAQVHLSLMGPHANELARSSGDGHQAVFVNQTLQGVGASWTVFTVNFTATASTNNATLTIVSSAPFEAYSVGAVSLSPTDAFHGMRKDVVAALKQLSFTGLLRYPGGCFAPFYRWQNGLLPPLQRAPVATPPNYCAAVPGGVNAYSDGFLENGIGTDEYIALCRELGAVPAITVALTFGGPEEIADAAAWVEYCNGAVTTKMGALRASRGHPEPYAVKYWYLGNEINIQARFRGYPATTNSTGPPTGPEYAAMLSEVARAMLAVDPSVRLLTVEGGAAWDRAWGAAAGPSIHATSYHAGYYGPSPSTPEGFVEAAKHPTVAFVPGAAKLRQQLSADARTAHVLISADEWGLGPPWLVRHFGVAHAMYAASFLAGTINHAAALGLGFTNYFEPVNEGAIEVTPHAAELTPLGRVMPLYAGCAGQGVLPLAAQGPADDVYATACLMATEAVAEGGTGAALNGTAAVWLTIANRNSTQGYLAPIELAGASCVSPTVSVEALEPDQVSPSGAYVARNWTAGLDANQSYTLPMAPYAVYRVKTHCGAA